MEESKIIMEGKCKLVDVEARTQIMALSTRIDKLK